MSDENQTETPAPEATTTTTTTAPAARYTDDDVARILAAHAAETPSEPDDPVARFRASAAGTKLYAKPGAAKPAAQPTSQSEMSELIQLQKMAIMQQLAASTPKPPAPPKQMTFTEKLASDDASLWLHRSNPNAFTPADREQLIAQHEKQLRTEGFKGHVEIEARARASRDVNAAATKALRNMRFSATGASGLDLNALLGRR